METDFNQDHPILKRFKILKYSLFNKTLQQCPDYIPWAMIAKHEAQAKKNHDQTLERLNARGGLSPTELYAVLNDIDYAQVTLTEYECVAWIKYKMEQHIKTGVIS